MLETINFFPGYYFFKPQFGGNTGLIIGEQFSIAIDASIAPSYAIEMRKVVDIDALIHLVYTHSHGDHVFGSRVLNPHLVIGSYPLRDRMIQNLSSNWTEENLAGYKNNNPDFPDMITPQDVVLPNTLVNECDIYVNGKKLQIISTAGHTSDSAIIWIPEDSILFTGDLLFAERVPYAGDPTVNPDAWISAFDRIIEFSPRIIVPGHGDLSTVNEVEKQRSFFDQVRKIILDQIHEGKTQEEISKVENFPEFYEDERNWLPMMYSAWSAFYLRQNEGE